MAFTLEDIVDRLDRHRQRATYGAVAGLLGKNPRSLMGRLARSHRYSWVVSKKRELPSGYGLAEMHPQLKNRQHVISDTAELKRWLETNT